MCTSLEWFEKQNKIKPILASLHNGSGVLAEIVGNVILSNNLILKSALFLPEFSLNLISISKLNKIAKCSFTFTDSKCSIQDHLRRMIGSAKLKGGLHHISYKGKSINHKNNMLSDHCSQVDLDSNNCDINNVVCITTVPFGTLD